MIKEVTEKMQAMVVEEPLCLPPEGESPQDLTPIIGNNLFLNNIPIS